MARDVVLKRFIERIKDDFYHETDGYVDAFCAICEVAVDIAYRNTKCALIGEEKTGAKRDLFAMNAGHIMKGYSDSQGEDYEASHIKMCEACVMELKKAKLPANYGVAQMIVNLATKYVFSHWYCGDDTYRLALKNNYHFLLNSYTLRWLNCCGVDGKPKCLNRNTVWENLNYEQYTEIQRYAGVCVNTLFPEYSCIEAEFIIEEEVKLYDALKTLRVFEKVDPENSILNSARNYFGDNDKVKLHDFMEAINN